ncbi:MAG: radical SAM/SPASM domain-containing protein [Promethearchaeota archaeon]
MMEEDLDDIIGNLNGTSEDRLKELHKNIFSTKPLFDVELSTFCNANCRICPREKISRMMGNMTESTIDILYEWLPEDCNLMFCGLGEPLLNPKVIEIIKKIEKKKINIAITTNGLQLTPGRIEQLLNSNIDMIQISVNGFSQDTYDKICPHFDFNLLKKNLDYLSNTRSKRTLIQLAFVKQANNEMDLIKLKDFSKKNKFSFFVRKSHSRGGYFYKPNEKISFKGCGLFIKASFITWNGDILACCHDLEGKTRLGNITDISYNQLKEIKMKYIEKYDWFNICQYCDDLFSRYVLLDNPRIIDT